MKTRYFRYLLLLPFIALYYYHIQIDIERGIGLGLVSLMLLVLIAFWNNETYRMYHPKKDWIDTLI